LAAFAICIAMVPAAYAQTVYMPPPRDKNWTESQPLYQPYTGPGFGNPDTPKNQPVGQAKKKYNDAAGTSAYSSGGNPEATQLGPKPRKPKSKNPQPDGSPQQQAPGSDKR
jgi:hypothetical protein